MKNKILAQVFGITFFFAVAGGAHATIMIYEGLVGGSGDVANVLFNSPTDVLIGETVTGHLKSVEAQQVDFTGKEMLSASSGGGQAHVVSLNNDGFDWLQINMHDTSTGFQKIQFNIEASVLGDISLQFYDQYDTLFEDTYALTKGNNKFTAIASHDQLIMRAIVDAETSIAAIGDFKQVRLGGDDITPVPEPATMLLFGVGMAGLVGSRLRRKK